MAEEESDQWYNQLKQLVSKTLDKRTSNRAVDYEQQILKYKEEWVIQQHAVNSRKPKFFVVKDPTPELNKYLNT